MDNASKYSKVGLLLFLVIWAALAAVFAFSDLQISLNIADLESAWAHLFEAYGQLPGMFLALLGANVLLRLRWRERGAAKIAVTVLLALWTLFLGFGFWGDAMGLQVVEDQAAVVPLAAGLGVVTVIALQILFRFVPDETLRKFERPSKIIVLMSILASMVTIWTFKILWGRVTFRELLPDYSNFTPWYLPQGNNGHHSFPSGHTSWAWLVLPVTLLFARGKRSWWAAWAVVIVWGVAAALSRVVIGAHYASDVLFGASFTISWFLILNRVAMPIGEALPELKPETMPAAD